MKPLCQTCNTRHETYQAHVFATNGPSSATNKVRSATNAATNKANGETPLDQPVIPVVGHKPTGVDSPERRTLNRRSRGAYNRYQKFYMQCVRALKSGRAEVWKG